MAPLVKKLQHVCITVPDLDEALGFYRDVLGLHSVFHTRSGDADGRLLGFDADEIGLYAHHLATAVDGTEINLVEYTAPKTLVGEKPYAQMNHVGITRLAFLVEDIDAAFETLRVYPGVKIVCAPKNIIIRAPHGNFVSRWGSFTDPYGIFVTFNQAPTPVA